LSVDYLSGDHDHRSTAFRLRLPAGKVRRFPTDSLASRLVGPAAASFPSRRVNRGMAVSGLLRNVQPAPTLAVFAVLAAVGYVLATPVVSTVSTQGPDGSRVVESGYASLPLLAVVIQAVAAVVIGTALVLIVRGRRHVGRRLLLAGAVAGLIPAVVPGVLAAAAWFVLGKANEPRNQSKADQ
jgi:hypothetical protein